MLCGDCLDVLKDFPDNCFHLIVTSPPYADARKRQYGGFAPDKYSEWFLPRAAQFKRVLKPSGTFILNIKEGCVGGERSVYVIELILALRDMGWLWTEHGIWSKTTSVPGYWPNRFRDAWEHLLQFNKRRDFAMYQEAVMKPPSEGTIKRMRSLNPNDRIRDNSDTESGFGSQRDRWAGRKLVNPTNVLTLSPVAHNSGHPASFPEGIPEHFIKLFSVEGDNVLDPFAGSGTTLHVAQRLHRNAVGVEIKEEYCSAFHACDCKRP